MRSAIALVAATGAVAGVAAQTSPADCTNQWTSSCDAESFGFTVDPLIAHLPVCASDTDCINDGLTDCGPGVLKDANGANTQVWLTAAGDLQSVIKNDIWGGEANTCGADDVQVLYQDPLTTVDTTVTNADGSTTVVPVSQYTGCYANLEGQTVIETGLTDYPAAGRNYRLPAGVTGGTASCRVNESKGAPTCRCRATGSASSGSQCKALYDATQTGTTAEKDFNAARLRAFQATNQCKHFTAETCASAQLCLYAGPNINKVCTADDGSVKVDASGNIVTDATGTDTPKVSTCRTNHDPASANLFTPGSANERCTCEATHCTALWTEFQVKLDARDAAIAVAVAAETTASVNLNRAYRCPAVVTGNENPCSVLDVYDDFNEDMARLEAAGQCVGGRPGSNVTATPGPEYSMHIGLVAGIAAGSVALAALITSALVCILMYACRGETHVQTQARNQRAMAMGGGQSAVIYGRSGHEMEMTRRSRY
jgi:hypothetical protein